MSIKGATLAYQIFFDVDRNAESVLKVFNAYYRAHNHSGKSYDDFPDFFLVRPEFIEGQDIASRSSEKMLLDDCIQRAKARSGYIGVTKNRNPKLGYYWLELSVFPFMLGDPVTEENKGEFFHILTKFIDYTKSNPKAYGDLTAEIDSDKDLALMLKEIGRMAGRLAGITESYPLEMLVSFNPAWPVSEVKKLLGSLKDNDQDWCEVFFEHLIYVMGKKTKA